MKTDKALLKSVTQKLARGGTGSQCRVNATVAQGGVTLSGTLQYEAQRAPLLKLVARINGVRRVVDQLRLLPKKVYPTGPVRVVTTTEAVEIELVADAVVEPVLESPAEAPIMP